jgi:hypothetical protein
MARTPQILPLAGMTPLGLAPPAELPAMPAGNATAEAIAQRRKALDARRGAAPVGGLFDQVERDQLDLF